MFLRILAIILLAPIMLPCSLFILLGCIFIAIMTVPFISLFILARGDGLECFNEIGDFLSMIITDCGCVIFRMWFGLE